MSSLNARKLLCVTVSIIALSVASPQVRGEELRPIAVRAADPGRCEWWGEGGVTTTIGGDAHLGGFGFDGGKSKWGPEVAAGFDCRFALTPWHVSAQVRYGSNSQQSGAFNPRGTFLSRTARAGPGTPSAFVPVLANGSGNFSQRETHALADFAVGRDVGLGLGQTQLKVGLRIAEIEAKASGAGAFNVPAFAISLPAVDSANAFGFAQNSRFAGAGPRLGIDGSIPLGGGWAFDYLGGICCPLWRAVARCRGRRGCRRRRLCRFWCVGPRDRA